MFKNKIFIKLLTFFVLLYLPLFAEDTQQMTIRLNGHEYQVDDIFSKKVKELYEQEKKNIKDAMIVEIKRVQNDDFKELNINLPDNISVIHTDFVLKDWTD